MSAPKILLVEDNPSTQALVRQALGGLAHELCVATDARQAIEQARKGVQLILMDMGLPDKDGLDLAAELQADPRTQGVPIIVLTGREDVASKVAAFALGVEDYVVKPFNLLELRARVEAKLRRLEQAGVREDTLVRGELRLSLSRQKCYRRQEGSERDADLELTATEFKLLYQLARREEHVLTRDQLLELVWGDSTEVLDRTVDAHVSLLRKKLGDLGSCIRAVHGQGYSFVLKPASQG